MAIVIIFLCVFLLFWFLDWIVHVLMVVSDPYIKSYSFGTWHSFILCYNNRTWHRVGKSWFSDDNNSSIGSGCIEFDKHGMILDPVSFLRYESWIMEKNYTHNFRFMTKHEWK